jgi:hypothetical protein
MFNFIVEMKKDDILELIALNDLWFELGITLLIELEL